MSTRKLKPTWKMDNDKTGQKRESLSQREVETVEFESFGEVLDFAKTSDKHGVAVMDLLNSQLHIRFGSQLGRNLMLQDFDASESTNLVDEEWKSRKVVKLNYLIAFNEAATKVSESGGISSDTRAKLKAMTPEQKKAFDAFMAQMD
jgi:hypothetical protein